MTIRGDTEKLASGAHCGSDLTGSKLVPTRYNTPILQHSRKWISGTSALKIAAARILHVCLVKFKHVLLWDIFAGNLEWLQTYTLTVFDLGPGGPGGPIPLTTKNEAPAPKFYKI